MAILRLTLLAGGLVAGLAAVFPAPIPASEAIPDAETEAPALAGRIAWVDGAVAVRFADDAAWSVAEPNDPIAGRRPDAAVPEDGDAVRVGNNSHARIDVGSAQLSLSPETEIDLIAFDPGQTQVRLTRGAVDIRLDATTPPSRFAVTTPQGTVELAADGLYRLVAGTDTAPTEIMVWQGGADPGDEGQHRPVEAGQRAALYPSGGIAVFDNLPALPAVLEPGIAATPPPEIASQNVPEAVPADVPAEATVPTPPGQGQPYVLAEQSGYQDLDHYGQWDQTPAYGPIWFPVTVAPDWAPYRFGHWRLIRPWGWTWIDDAPWGFTPFHYGRWIQIDGRWGWVPGPRRDHPTFSPAQVAFPTPIPGGRAARRDRPPVDWVPLTPTVPFEPLPGAATTVPGTAAMPDHGQSRTPSSQNVIEPPHVKGPVVPPTLHPAAPDLHPIITRSPRAPVTTPPRTSQTLATTPAPVVPVPPPLVILPGTTPAVPNQIATPHAMPPAIQPVVPLPLHPQPVPAGRPLPAAAPRGDDRPPGFPGH
ncbi:MAG: hypothetical protein P4M00_18025 [Azospirillaceae bacterium]|nr:hypothetical protein [Azospirillaceae bacterium]